MLILTNRSFRNIKSLYDSWSSLSKNLASQLEQHNAAGNLDQSIGRDTVTYCCDVLWMDWAFRMAKTRKNLVKQTYDTGDNPIETVGVQCDTDRGILWLDIYRITNISQDVKNNSYRNFMEQH